MNTINYLKKVSQSSWYWLLYIGGGIIMLLAALFFQYVLEEPPCVVCIQVRLLFTLYIFVAIFGLFSRKNKLMSSISQLCLVLTSLVLAERSYLLLGTERGFIFADCGFDLGLPSWFAIEQWLPWLYRIETSCGYTPEIIFGITMAESLMVMSVFLIIVSFCLFAATILPYKTKE